MIYKIFPEKDTTIYSIQPSLNAGLDEILELNLSVGEEPNPAAQTSRILIKFDPIEVNEVINLVGNNQYKVYLKLFDAGTTGLNIDTIVDIFPISGSWEMGTGRRANDPITDNGTSWGWRGVSGSDNWIPSIYNFSTSSYSGTIGGGTWYTSSYGSSLFTSSISQSFTYYSSKDLNLEVTDIIKWWASGSILGECFMSFDAMQDNDFWNNPNFPLNISISSSLFYLANVLQIVNTTPSASNQISNTDNAGYVAWMSSSVIPALISSSLLSPYFENIHLVDSVPQNATDSGFYNNYGVVISMTSRYNMAFPLTGSLKWSVNIPYTESIYYNEFNSNINNGFILKVRNEFTNNINIQPKLKFFSRDTHTIYPPHLEFKWSDYSINSGSVSFLTSSDYVINVKQTPDSFEEEITRFRIYSRPKYPVRNFQTSSVYLDNYYLPLSSSYAIKDLDTNEYVIDFDDVYTKLSIDSESSYFDLHMDGLEPQRYYKILIKIKLGNLIDIVDNDILFKVI